MENLKADVVEMFTAKTAGLPGKSGQDIGQVDGRLG